jgi:ribosomal protein L14
MMNNESPQKSAFGSLRDRIKNKLSQKRTLSEIMGNEPAQKDAFSEITDNEQAQEDMLNKVMEDEASQKSAAAVGGVLSAVLILAIVLVRCGAVLINKQKEQEAAQIMQGVQIPASDLAEQTVEQIQANAMLQALQEQAASDAQASSSSAASDSDAASDASAP